MQIFFLNGLWRLLKDGHLPVKLHSSAPRGGEAAHRLWLRLHGVIYCPDSFVLMLRYCANLKTIRYESMSLNKIVAGKLHRVIVA